MNKVRLTFLGRGDQIVRIHLRKIIRVIRRRYERYGRGRGGPVASGALGRVDEVTRGRRRRRHDQYDYHSKSAFSRANTRIIVTRILLSDFFPPAIFVATTASRFHAVLVIYDIIILRYHLARVKNRSVVGRAIESRVYIIIK